MFSIIKRILRLSGKYRPRVIAGLIFNALKSCCAAFVFFAVLLVMLNIEHLTETVILQAFGIVALSVLGRFLFQYLSDVLMSASGYEIFREKRLEIGNQLKRAPMGYFTENNLGTVQTVLTTTISDLEGNCMLALTFLVGGFVQALAMTLMLGIFCWQIGFLALTGILAGILVLGQIKKRAGAHTEDMQNAQELLVGSALEYIKGISVLRIFGKGKEGKGKVDQAFENKCRSDIAVTISTAGIMKLYEAVFKITSCLLFLLSALLYLWGVITLPYCLLFIICAFLMFMELELMNDGAFLSKMLATQLDRLDFISDIPVLDGDGSPLWSLLAAITYFLVAAKTKKPWTLFIFCAITGIYGFYPPMIICCIIAGIISALIAWKTGCTNGKTLTISYIIYMVLAAFSGTYIPFLFFSNQTLEQYAGMFGESYLGILQTLVSPVTAIIMLVVVAICAFVGALNAKKLLKKHFKKAGIV